MRLHSKIAIFSLTATAVMLICFITNRSQLTGENIERLLGESLSSKPVFVSLKQAFPEWYKGFVRRYAARVLAKQSRHSLSKFVNKEIARFRAANEHLAQRASVESLKQLGVARIQLIEHIQENHPEHCSPALVSGRYDASKSLVFEGSTQIQVMLNATGSSLLAAILDGKLSRTYREPIKQADSDLLIGHLKEAGWKDRQIRVLLGVDEPLGVNTTEYCRIGQRLLADLVKWNDKEASARLLAAVLIAEHAWAISI